MKILLSLPPNVVDCFHDISGLSREEYFCTCDPVGHRLGSGGGTAWLLEQACLDERGEVRTSERPEHGEGRGGGEWTEDNRRRQSHPKELSLAPSTVRNHRKV